MAFTNITAISVETGSAILAWVWFAFVDVSVALTACKPLWTTAKEIAIGCVTELIYGTCPSILTRISCKKIFYILNSLYLSALSVKTPLICFAVRKSCKEQTYWCSFPLWLWVWCSPHPPSPGHRFWSPSSRHTSSVLYSPPRGYRIQSTGPRNSRSDTVPPWTVAAWVNVIIEQSKLECQGMQQM